MNARIVFVLIGWGVLFFLSSSLDSVFTGNACVGWFFLCALLPVERMFGPQVIVRNRRERDD